MVPAHDHDGAARPRRAREAQLDERRARHGPGDAQRRGARREPDRLRRGRARASASRRLPSRTVGTVRPDHRSVALERELGRRRPSPPRQRRGVRPFGVEPEVARDPRPRALDGVLHGPRGHLAASVPRPLPQGRGQRLGPTAARDAPRANRRRRLHRPHRGRLAGPADALDAALPRRRRLALVRAERRRRRVPSRRSATARRSRRRRSRRRPRSPGRSRRVSLCPRRRRTPTCS